MSSLDLELDGLMDDLELEWREAHEASIIARAEYRALAANPEPNALAIETNAIEVVAWESLHYSWKTRIFQRGMSLCAH